VKYEACASTIAVSMANATEAKYPDFGGVCVRTLLTGLSADRAIVRSKSVLFYAKVLRVLGTGNSPPPAPAGLLP